MSHYYSIPKEIPMMLADGAARSSQQTGEVLERYFNDLYLLFQSKLARFAMEPVSEAEHRKLETLLEEMIKTKQLLYGPDTLY